MQYQINPVNIITIIFQPFVESDAWCVDNGNGVLEHLFAHIG